MTARSTCWRSPTRAAATGLALAAVAVVSCGQDGSRSESTTTAEQALSGACGGCQTDADCQSCPAVRGGGSNCCDAVSGVCYATADAVCPATPLIRVGADPGGQANGASQQDDPESRHHRRKCVRDGFDDHGDRRRGCEFARIHAYLNSFYAEGDIKHSFVTASGQQVDCIDFYAQSSVKALRAQGIHVTDVLPPPPRAALGPPPNTSQSLGLNGQLDSAGRTEYCPPGTVPAGRPTVATIQAAGGVDAYKQYLATVPHPQQNGFQHDCWMATAPPQEPPAAGYYEHAAGLQNTSFVGATTTLSVNTPGILASETNFEHSLSQMWIQTGDCETWAISGGPTTCSGQVPVQSAEFGWMVGPNLVSGVADLNPHLFSFETNDGYVSGCWGGGGGACWVALSATTGTQFFVGEDFTGLPGPGQAPLELQLDVDNLQPGNGVSTAGWYVYLNGNPVGFFPIVGAGFTGTMETSATYLQVGGEVFDAWEFGVHTATQMGSGFPSQDGFPNAAYQRNVGYAPPACAGCGANPYQQTDLGFIYTPAADGDLLIPGLCGYLSGSYYNLSLGLPTGSFGWGQYFYFGEQ